jgi:hypothetical protein
MRTFRQGETLLSGLWVLFILAARISGDNDYGATLR